MAARDNAASVQGEMIRITPLLVDGSIDGSQPILTTTGFISASFGTEFEDGDEISEKAANGRICIQYKADDSLTGITFNLSLCSPDPEASALIAGGRVIMDANGDVVGYSSPAVGDLVGKPIAVEIWSKAIINGKPASGQPYFHWVFPYVRVRYEGDREFTNGALVNEFAGTGVGNEALACPGAGLNPANPADDFVIYRDALRNPFSYVRTATLPAAGWSTPTWEGGGIGPNCAVIPPAGGTPLDVTITLGLTGTGASGPAAEVGGGQDGGVRIVPRRSGADIPLANLTTIDWGDGVVNTPPDTSGGFVAHIYTTPAPSVSITVIDAEGSGTSAPFEVVPDQP